MTFGDGGGGGVGVMTFLNANIDNCKSYTKNKTSKYLRKSLF